MTTLLGVLTCFPSVVFHQNNVYIILFRYIRSTDNHINGEDQQEEETSGATSGEEIWGTPTSGEMDDTPNSPRSYEGKQSVRK